MSRTLHKASLHKNYLHKYIESEYSFDIFARVFIVLL